MSAFFSPLLGQLGSRAADTILAEETARIVVDSCLPLLEARSIIRFDGALVADEPTYMMNETSVYIYNRLNENLEDVIIDIVTLPQYGDGNVTMYSEIVGNSIQGFKNASVTQKNDNYRLNIPRLLHNERVILQANVNRPVSYLVEIYHKSGRGQYILTPGCVEGEWEYPVVGSSILFSYVSESCELNDSNTLDCKIEQPPLSFNVTEEIRGKEMQAEIIMKREP